MRRMIMCLLALIIILPTAVAMAGSPEKEKAGVSSAEKWLSLVDKGEYARSRQEAAVLFKNALDEKQWVKTLHAVREPLGKIISRTINTKIHTTSLPGAPDGEYVVIQFNTSFENKKKAVETLTVMLDKDGARRTAGYYIK